MRRKRDENEPRVEAKTASWVSIDVSEATEGAAGRAAWPPPPHDPSDRAIVAQIGEWEVRRFPEGGKLFNYAAPRGMLHLQLWHPALRVSVLTPSRITGGRYELFPVNGWKRSCREWRSLLRTIRLEHHLALPAASRVVALERWFVAGPERAAVRAYIAATVGTR